MSGEDPKTPCPRFSLPVFVEKYEKRTENFVTSAAFREIYCQSRDSVLIAQSSTLGILCRYC